MKNTHQHF
uniref:Uncharacterized protein n=1 Tax=Anguilla anguilla TaxID=7936 RepID=A0A0E9V595_ANGAN